MNGEQFLKLSNFTSINHFNLKNPNSYSDFRDSPNPGIVRNLQLPENSPENSSMALQTGKVKLKLRIDGHWNNENRNEDRERTSLEL